MHTYKYAIIEGKIQAIQKILDESATLLVLLNSCERAKKRPRLKYLAPLAAAFDGYLVGMVEYPTVNQKVLLSRADGLILTAKSDMLEMYHGQIPIDSSLIDLINSELGRALSDLWECYVLVEDKVIPTKKRRQ